MTYANQSLQRFSKIGPSAWLTLFAALLIIVVSGLQIVRSRNAALTQAALNVQNLSRSLAQQAERTIQGLDLVISGVAERLEADGLRVDTGSYLERRRHALLHVHSLVVTDRSGGALYEAGDAPAGSAHAGQADLAWHKDHRNTSILVANPERDAADKPILPVTRRYDRADGSFAGLIIGSLDLAAISDSYNTIDIGKNGTITLWNETGYLIARRPPIAGAALTQRYGNDEMIRSARIGVPITHSLVSPIDGVDRIIAYCRVDSYPTLIVSAALSTDEVLAAWRRESILQGAIILMGASVLIAAGILLEIRGRQTRTFAATLAKNEARFRLIAENTSDVLQLGHDDGRRSYTSPAIERLLGYTVPEFEAMKLRHYIHPDDLAAFYATTRGLVDGSREASTACRALHKTRGWIWVEGVFRRIPGACGDEPTIIGTFRDISERRQQAEALLRSKEEADRARMDAEKASAAKTDFLASMSHEIRTPLSGVLGYTELLLEDSDLRGPQRKNVERIQNAGTALLTVVNDILDFSKIEAGQIDLEPQPFSLAAMIDNAVSIMRGPADRKGLPIDIEIDPTLPPWLLGDQDRLRQILLNLLNNAVKFTAVGRITVAAHAQPGALVRFCVTDTGIGIPIDKRAHLFERFSQVDNSIARRFGGTGLGLAICKSLVTLMGGTIGVESGRVGGSTFWLAIPLGPSAAPVSMEIETERAFPAPRAMRILLVDDLEVNRDLGRAMLTNAGHTVELAEDGIAAIAAVLAGAYDLVLMDVQMPGMDGLTATRRIRALPGPERAIPIVAMTANILPDQVAACRAAGMDGHVGKPIRRSELNAALERYGAGTNIASSTDPSPRAAFDKEVFDDLSRLLGPKMMNGLLGKLADHLRGVLDKGISATADPSDLSRDSHNINSMAGTIGFVGLSALCADLERACRDGTDRDRLVPLVREAGSMAIEQIERLRAV